MDNSNPDRIINLYEYANQESLSGDEKPLEDFLDEIWNNRDKKDFSYQTDTGNEESYDNAIASKQKFLTFLKNGDIKSRKYVGIIKFDNQVINLLPKIFYRDDQSTPNEKEVKAIQANILWWLSYCKKIKFPKSSSSLSSIKSNFFEILIYLFASYTKHILGNCLYQSYNDVQKELGFMKGRLNTQSYLTQNISKGNWHKISCSYDSFEFDNLFNRIIKSVATILIGTSKNFENKQLLSEILFILDEVSDIRATYDDCQKVKLNPLFEEMNSILDYCKLFLANSVSFSYKNQFKVFAFLLPMEYVFEDFLYGFIEKHFKGNPDIKKLKSQKSDLYLAKLFQKNKLVKNEVFNLQHDIYFKYKGKKVIVDAKYKLTYTTEKNQNIQDNKHGVSQSDLYQVVSYGIRRNATDIFLIYPQTLDAQMNSTHNGSIQFKVHDELAGKDININIIKISIIHNEYPEINTEKNLQKNFSDTESNLYEKLDNSLFSIKE